MRGSSEEDTLCSFFDPWYCVNAEADPLRRRLEERIELAERSLEESGAASRHIRNDMRVKLEIAYRDFLRFKNSRSAWQDIHGADPDLISTARSLLNRLR